MDITISGGVWGERPGGAASEVREGRGKVKEEEHRSSISKRSVRSLLKELCSFSSNIRLVLIGESRPTGCAKDRSDG